MFQHDENCRRSYPETKVKSEKLLKKANNSIKIWCTVTSKQYALYHLVVKLSSKFQRYRMKTVGVVQIDAWTDNGGCTIITCHYLVAGYFFFCVCVEVLRPSQPNGVMSSAVSLPNHTFTGQA